jgi:3'(2'), 5'-bisphosphate nucleotidase
MTARAYHDHEARPAPASREDHRDAVEIATATGRMLLDLRSELPASRLPADELGRAADRAANAFILARLAARHPHDPVLTEEAPDGPARLGSRRVWIVDPLDGTVEYAQGRDDWGVNIALAVDGVPVAGAVAVPALGDTLSTEHPLDVPPREQWPVLVVSRSRPPAFAAAVAERLRAELRPLGSAAAKAASVVLGEADAYLHAGGMYEWDSAAPVAVAAACGLHVSRLDGSPPRYNRRDTRLPDLLICRPEIAGDVLDALREVGAR